MNSSFFSFIQISFSFLLVSSYFCKSVYIEYNRILPISKQGIFSWLGRIKTGNILQVDGIDSKHPLFVMLSVMLIEWYLPVSLEGNVTFICSFYWIYCETCQMWATHFNCWKISVNLLMDEYMANNSGKWQRFIYM